MHAGGSGAGWKAVRALCLCSTGTYCCCSTVGAEPTVETGKFGRQNVGAFKLHLEMEDEWHILGLPFRLRRSIRVRYYEIAGFVGDLTYLTILDKQNLLYVCSGLTVTISPFAKLMSRPSPSFLTGIFKSGYSLDFFIEQTVTTIARKLNFSGFGRNFSSFSQTSVLQSVIFVYYRLELTCIVRIRTRRRRR